MDDLNCSKIKKLIKEKFPIAIDISRFVPTFLIGGALRDTLEGKVPNDLDFVVLDKSDEIIKFFIDSFELKYKINKLGEYKKKKNFVGNITTSLPSDVASDMKELLEWYDKLSNKTIEDIIEFHIRFEKIHPFQDGNGRVGRMIMFRECLYNDIMPFFIEDRNKDFYMRGIKEYQTNNEKGYLIDTCLNSQDNYEKMANYFLEDNS